MKKVLSLLLAYAFLQAETWAIGGGPNTNLSAAALVGTYAGVLIPRGQTLVQTGVVKSSAAIGLFGIGIPSTGFANGVAVAFVNGLAFTGNMTGIADPKDAKFTGLVEATSSSKVTSLVPVIDANGNVIFQNVTSKVFAVGNIKANIDGAGQISSVAGSSSAVRLRGTSQLDLYQSLNGDGTPAITNTVKFSLDGFKQSESSTTVTIGFNPGGSTTGG